MALEMTCDCGAKFQGKDADALMAEGKKHLAAKHPDMKLSEEQMKQMLAAKAKAV